MLVVSVSRFLKKLKNISVFDKFIIILIFIFTFGCLFIKINSVYSGNEKEICGRIDDFVSYDNKVTIEIKAKEKIIGYYHFKDLNTKNYFDNYYHLGDEVCVYGNLERPSGNTIFNLFNYRKYLLSKKIHFLVNVDKIEKISDNTSFIFTIKNKIRDKISNFKYSKSYLFTFILGDSRHLSDNIMKTYRSIGVSHLFAVSGMHISFLASVILFFLNYLTTNQTLKMIITTIFVIFVASIFVLSPSIVRATTLFLCLTVDKIFHLKQKSIKYLMAIFIINLIINRYAIYNVGFIFSYTISFFLLLYQEKLKNIKSKLKLSFMIAIISFLISIPILITNFFEINLITPFVNLIVVPYVSFILFPGAFICLFFSGLDGLYYWLIKILELIVTNLNSLNIFKISLAKPYFGVIVIYYILIFLIIHMLFKRKYGYLLALMFVIFIHHNIRIFDFFNHLYMIDVGQGDCMLLTLNSNRSVLIDTGGNIYNQDSNLATDKLIPFFKSVGLKKLDYVILTHGDYDHMGEAINLVNNFKVEKVIFNNDSYNELERELIQLLEKKNIKYYKGLEELNIDKYKMQFLNTKVYDNENDNSNVIYFNYNDYKFLFMGDAGVKKEKDILAKYNLKDVDFFKVGHHGSNTSSSEEFIKSITPKYSLISVGKNNRYGHPKDLVLEILSNSKTYRTDRDGSIEIKLKKSGYRVRICAP